MNPSSVSKPTIPTFTSNLIPFIEHLQRQTCNKDSLNSFANRIAQFKKSLIRILSQQAVQHPGKHADVLVQMESRLAKNRAYYATNEEISETFISIQLKRGKETSVRSVSLKYLTTGFLGFLWLLCPGRPRLEAILWYAGGR